MFGVLIANLSHGSSSTVTGMVLAATPSPSPSTVSSDFASALPTWLLITLSALVALIVVAMFALTAYNLSAPRSPLKRLLTARKPQDPELIKTLATSARVGTRTTRTTLAIAGFSLLGVAVVAVFGLSGQGVRDLRSQVVAAVTTLVAAIAGFYFGTRAAESPAAGGEPTTAAAAAPAVTGVSPTSGSVAGGDTVTVTGSGFTGATGVSFGTVAASNLVRCQRYPAHRHQPPECRRAGGRDGHHPGRNLGRHTSRPVHLRCGRCGTGSDRGQPDERVGGWRRHRDRDRQRLHRCDRSELRHGRGLEPGPLSAIPSSPSPAPRMPPGTVDVTVTTPAGTSAITPADQFTYADATFSLLYVGGLARYLCTGGARA